MHGRLHRSYPETAFEVGEMLNGACFCRSFLSRHCHGSRGKTLKNREQKVDTEEKLTLALHRNLLFLLGKLPANRY
jgi:hypothetical protein